MRRHEEALLILLLSAAVFGQKHAVRHDDIWLMKRVSEPAVSPDGKWLVFVVTQPDYDPEKLMNWLNGHTDQFKCIVNQAGAINHESQYGVNDGGWDRELRMGGPIWEKNGQWNEQSPIRYSGSFKTPTLITQGELDYRVPINESMTTFKILQRRKVPSRLVVFPDEGHWIMKGENSRKHMEEVLARLQRYL